MEIITAAFTVCLLCPGPSAGCFAYVTEYNLTFTVALHAGNMAIL